ncbi:unnamed protein product [Anisakis simplex]|uniref:Cap-specific mRNA (nucleoside-2'-O-)-methyltransferase 2 n=1 Tax=Anisakis simplex TaxID=6269 RepID=A0A0M3K2R9_ANISI|nr:unnamed protein product [Anisakis simplex]
MKRGHKSSSSFSDQKKFNEDETNDESSEDREREHLREQYSLMIDQLFYKRFSLKHHKATTIKKYDDVKLELLKLEERLNHVKSQIPTSHLKEWRLHTKRTHPMRPLVQQLIHNYGLQCCSQAFCKFYEILKRYPDLCELKSDPHENNELRSLHLCEAPGAFISALNVYLRLKKPDLKWSWRANTLNPHYEWTRTSDMFVDDELLTSTHSNWLFGEDNSGDIMQWDREYLNTLLENNEHYFNLITADGSLYCQNDPSNQECLTYPLLKKQVEISLFLLETGGSLVIKIYTMLREETSSLIARLLRSFDEVDLFKPSSSKPSNSEVYLICRGYKRDVMSTDIVMWTVIFYISSR